MDVVEVVPTFEEYAFTFGGVAPRRRVRPGTALRVRSDDAFCGALQRTTDLSSRVSSSTTGTNLVVDGALTCGIQR